MSGPDVVEGTEIIDQLDDHYSQWLPQILAYRELVKPWLAADSDTYSYEYFSVSAPGVSPKMGAADIHVNRALAPLFEYDAGDAHSELSANYSQRWGARYGRY